MSATATPITPTTLLTERVPGPKRKKRPRTASEWIVLTLSIVGALLVIAPMLLLVINAFKSPTEYANSSVLSLPHSLSFDGIKTFWNGHNFPRALWNSIFISGMVAILGVILSVLNSFAIGIGRVKGRTWLVLVFLMANLVPQEMLFDPLFKLYDKLGLLSNSWSVIITFTVIQSAFGTYLLSSLLGTFPKEILEAAAVDGASRFRSLRSVIVPILRPTLSVLMVFFFIWTWNEFFIPLVMLINNATQTIPVALASLQGDRLMDAPTTNAGALISLIPAVIFFFIFQRTLTRGVTAGAIK